MKALIILFAFGSLLSQCGGAKSNTGPDKEANTRFDPQNDILVRKDINSGEYKIAVNDEKLTQSLKVADLALEEVLKIFVKEADEDHLYLVFHLRDTSGNSVKKAVYLRQLSKGIFKAETSTREPISHVCEGNCCLDCDFRIKDKKFHGCDCQNQCPSAMEDTPGYCNHTISQSPSLILAPI